MSVDALKLTTYFGERERAGGRFLADALAETYARHAVRVSAVFRGVEGFGVKHHLQTDRLLTLSEDLPMVSVAVDERRAIERLLPEVEAVSRGGLITLERARLVTGPPAPPEGASKLTVYVGRHERAGGRPAAEAAVALMHRCGVEGATALLGVDGTAHGVRRRARFVGRNVSVPVMVIGVGDAERVAAAVPELLAVLPEPLMTLERVTVCKRDGARMAGLPALAAGSEQWQKLMVHGPSPLHAELVRRLRGAGATGATVLRGFWGYHGDHAPHGDRFWALRRRVPALTVIVERPERVMSWWPVVDELTASAGLVTSEIVPAAWAAQETAVSPPPRARLR